MMMIKRFTNVSQCVGKNGFKACLSTNSESYTDRQKKTGRPLSPHVEIYAFPITALSSITNRATGVALTFGIASIAGLTLADVNVSSLFSIIGNSQFAPVAKLAVSFPLAYHYLGTVRHLLWDSNPSMLENDQVATSSKILIGSSVAVSVVAAFLI